ncbi:response regulator transcription factor [Bradyrhizobium sp. SSUT18]|uniref:response regulator transcription factor n=1 Tax=unclassified Bradyrhizobium TaxID=2631580 RepID=UPI002446E41C|nr:MULTISPECIES: response regulator transcription factor [unclassified Bradyrhizobium]MDH2347693.1 response regulator transcription factor [Bradyrhizobium sp. SSUT77]MDH2352517.1 response regulator transcription factor [Bradyrhizobium sp. SSUT112]MDH2401336.1 response regulator transcription factor [Bradyrhizobium sp. SSUT18]
MKRILIADDHEAVRSGLRAVLEQRADWEVVAEANDGSKALTAAIESRPHVAIVDFSMPRMTGVEVARRIREFPLQTEVLIFTVHKSSLLAQQAFEAGAGAFLTKSDANTLLLAAVDALLAHRRFCSESCRNELDHGGGGADGRRGLTPREQLVVKLVAEGYSNKGISAILNLSVKTTEAHRAAAMRKLDVNSTAGLVRYAVRAQLVGA